jgi:hypothetical protein
VLARLSRCRQGSEGEEDAPAVFGKELDEIRSSTVVAELDAESLCTSNTLQTLCALELPCRAAVEASRLLVCQI